MKVIFVCGGEDYGWLIKGEVWLDLIDVIINILRDNLIEVMRELVIGVIRKMLKMKVVDENFVDFKKNRMIVFINFISDSVCLENKN